MIASRPCLAVYGFNPRARDGREVDRQWVRRYLLSFNPRARDGREKNNPELNDVRIQFQSTRP